MAAPTSKSENKPSVYRYCFSQNGRVYQAFSARLTSDDSIIISIRSDDRFNGLMAATGDALARFHVAADEDRISVHPSIGRTGVSITHNTRVAGKHVTAKLLVDATADTLIAVPLTKVQGCVGKHTAPVDDNAEGQRIILGSFTDADYTQLVYSIVILPLNTPAPELDGFSRVDRNIGIFRLSVYYCFPTVPTMGHCAGASPVTFSPQIDKVPIRESISKLTANTNVGEIDGQVFALTNQAMNAAISSLVSEQPAMIKFAQIPMIFCDSVPALRKLRREASRQKVHQAASNFKPVT